MNKKAKVHKYQWVAKKLNGKKVTGEISATNKEMARTQLRKQQLIILTLKKKSTWRTANKKVRTKDILYFTRHLATLINAGITIIAALKFIKNSQKNTPLEKLIEKLISYIDNGVSLNKALAKQPKYFDAGYCNLVAVGEQSGSLALTLNRLVIQKEHREKLTSSIKKALIYPTTLMLTSIIVLTVMMIYVVPHFANLYQNFQAELPPLTKLIILLSEHAGQYCLYGFLTAATMVFTKKVIKRNQMLCYLLDKWLLQAPLIGRLLKKLTALKFSINLSIMLGAGIPLIEALTFAADSSTNLFMKKNFLTVQTDIKSGYQLSKALRLSNQFDEFVIEMIRLGEETSTLEMMLLKISEHYENEVTLTLGTITTLLEPVLLLVSGILMGTVIIALYLPIFNMGSMF